MNLVQQLRGSFSRLRLRLHGRGREGLFVSYCIVPYHIEAYRVVVGDKTENEAASYRRRDRWYSSRWCHRL
jgi:hypothetical protein